MADNLGLKIGIEGEKEFKKALSEINQSFKVLGSEMKLVSSQFDKNDKSVQALSARNTVLNKEIEAQKNKVGSSEWVFPSPTGGPISPDSVLHMLHRVLKRAGLPRIRFHDLRHTFATMALQNGVDVKTVSSMLGHCSAGFTLDTYAHITTDAQLKAAQTMGSILSHAV